MVQKVEGVFSGTAWKVVDVLIRTVTIIVMAWVGWIAHQVDGLRAMDEALSKEQSAISTRVTAIEANRFTATDAMRGFREVEEKNHASVSILADKLDAKLDTLRAEITLVRESLARTGRVGP